MSLNSPLTALTDLLLGLTGLLMALSCLAHFRRTGSSRSRWWSLGFAALGIGALLGFINIGFDTGQAQLLGLVSRLSAGLAVFAMLSSVTAGLVGPEQARSWSRVYFLVYLAFASVTFLSASFLVFILYSGTALLATLALESYRWLGRGDPGAGLMFAGMAISILAAVLQALGISLGPVDPGSLYHLTQTAALFLLYRGVMAGPVSASAARRSA